MAARKSNWIILLLLSISSALGEPADNTDFYTEQFRVEIRGIPFKLGNELKLFDSDRNSVISIKPEHAKCQLTTSAFSPHQISNLGNGKLVMIRDTVTDFNVVDFKNCSSHVSTLISNGTLDYTEVLNYKYKLTTVVTYNDTFDVFDWYQTTCMPCRYNDKGERLQVEHSLEQESTGQDRQNAHQHDGYSLELVKDAFGLENGYFYVFRYANETTALKILDSNFKVVKQRLFNAKIEAHSLLQENITVCYKQDACRRQWRSFCLYAKCHILDSDLSSIAELELHQASTEPQNNKIWVDLNVQNLAGGGAMVALKFHFDRSKTVHRKDVFLQRIHPNGRVDKPIPFDSIENDFTYMYDFTFDNGEYCLVTVNEYYSKDISYTLVKCLNPSPAEYSKV